MVEYTWTQPIGGTKLRWSPLTVGQEIEIEMAHQRPDTAPLRKYEVLRRRIVAYGEANVCTFEQLKGWDPADLEAFVEEVEAKESERRAALSRKTANATKAPADELEAAVAEFKVAFQHVSLAADKVISAMKAAPGPLK